jgi:hypothetical protein
LLCLTSASVGISLQDPDEDFLDFWDALRLAILDTYTSILQGLRAADVGHLFAPFAEFSVMYVEHVWQDEDRSTELTKCRWRICGPK